MPMSLAADAVQPFPDTPTIRRRDAVAPGSWPEGTLPLLGIIALVIGVLA